MKNTLNIFNSLNLDLELFYSIRVNKGELYFQGDYNSTLIASLKNDGYEFTIDDFGYSNGKKIFNLGLWEENVTVNIIMT
jgi:hypothetical protein